MSMLSVSSSLTSCLSTHPSLVEVSERAGTINICTFIAKPALYLLRAYTNQPPSSSDNLNYVLFMIQRTVPLLFHIGLYLNYANIWSYFRTLFLRLRLCGQYLQYVRTHHVFGFSHEKLILILHNCNQERCLVRLGLKCGVYGRKRGYENVYQFV